MDRSWFDSDDMGLGLGLGLGLGRRWGASTASLFEEARGLEMELQASSLRLRETARLAVGGGHSRRGGLAHRINSIMRNTGDGVKSSQGEYEELNKNLRAIKEENLKLKAVINDVTEVNKRWQKYNNDRQMYVQRLLTTIQDQQEQINKMVADRAFATPALEAVEASNPLQDVVAGLQRQMERLDLEHGETVEVLKFQVKAHHDDWEAERREKQQALQDKLAAEAKIRQLHKELRAHKLKPREERLETTESRCCCSNACETEPEPRLSHCRNENTKMYRTSVHVPCNAGHLLSRGTTLSFDDDLAMDGDQTKTPPTSPPGASPPPDSAPNAVRMGFGGDGLASVLSFPQTIVKSHSLPNPTESEGNPRPGGPAAVSAESLLPWKPKCYQEGVDTQTRQDIICPVCDRLFPPTSHVKFLDHFGRCQDNAAIGQKP